MWQIDAVTRARHSRIDWAPMSRGASPTSHAHHVRLDHAAGHAGTRVAGRIGVIVFLGMDHDAAVSNGYIAHQRNADARHHYVDGGTAAGISHNVAQVS